MKNEINNIEKTTLEIQIIREYIHDALDKKRKEAAEKAAKTWHNCPKCGLFYMALFGHSCG